MDRVIKMLKIIGQKYDLHPDWYKDIRQLEYYVKKLKETDPKTGFFIAIDTLEWIAKWSNGMIEELREDRRQNYET